MTRLENALEEEKIHIDEYKSVEQQVQDILKKLRPILPIKFEVKEIAVKIPSQFAGKATSALRAFGKLLKQEWQPDGSLVAVVEIPGGLEQDFYDKLNSITHGDNESKVIETR